MYVYLIKPYIMLPRSLVFVLVLHNSVLILNLLAELTQKLSVSSIMCVCMIYVCLVHTLSHYPNAVP